MPTVLETTIAGYASCMDALCPGYRQEPVGVVRREQQFSYIELGGDLPGIERSSIDAAGFADDTDIPCPHCGKPRIAALDERPDYPRTSGQDPLRLLNMTHDQQVRDMQISGLQRDKQVAEMTAELARLRADLAEQRHPAPQERPSAPKRDRAA